MSELSLESLKKGMLKLLKEDEEFRYAVAAYLGYHEILEKLKLHGKKIEEVIKKLNIIEKDVKSLKEDVSDLKEDVSSLKKDVAGLKQDVSNLKKDVKSLKGDVASLKQDVSSLKQDVSNLKQDVASLKEDVASLKEGQRSMMTMLERLSLSLEEEAREVVEYMLREKGFSIKLEPLVLEDVEFDLFGSDDEAVVIGEATVRLGVKQLVKADERMEKFLKIRREYASKKAIKVVYTMWVAQGVKEEAEKRGIWLIRSGREETTLPLASGSG